MPITFSCSHCQSKMTVPDNLAGKNGKCSKCKNPITVPATGNGPAAMPAAPARPAPARVAAVGAKPAPPPPPPPVDIEAAALEALADAPREEEKALEAIEFTCPQCDEPIKMPLAEAGKRAPCPSCSRIIPVPVPQTHKEKNWRDTGPKMPAAAKRDLGPELEGAWGTDKSAGLSQEAAEEAGLIPEKDRPLTFYQRYQTHLLIGVPTLLVLAAGYYLWGWYAAGREARYYHSAVAFAAGDAGRQTDPAALAGLRVAAGLYQSRTAADGSAERAKEQYAAALALLRGARGAARDAVLIDLARLTAALGGEGDDVGREARLKWDEAQKLTRQSLTAIAHPAARLAGLRAVAAVLIGADQANRATVLAGQIAADDADRADLLGAVGLELLKAGKRELAEQASRDSAAVYPARQEEAKGGNGKAKPAPRPPLRSQVVALAVALNRTPPEAGNNLAEREAATYGTAAGLAAAGNLEKAREVCKSAATNEAALVAWIHLVAACESPTADDLATAIARLREAPDRRGLDWELLRMLGAALRARGKAEEIDAILTAIPTPALRGWGQLMVIRDQARGRTPIPTEAVEPINAKSTAGLLARLEAARQNVWLNPGWAGTVAGWEEAPRAFGSMGAALGLQGGRDDR